ncbi:MAG: YfiR family protein [Alphaproteobacteria bacterium]
MKNNTTRFLVAIILALNAVLAPAAVLASAKTESEIKAAYIYKFVLLLKWPDDKELKDDVAAEVNICTLGVENIGDLQAVSLAATQRSKGLRTFKVVPRNNWAGVGGACHIFYIGNSQAASVGAIVNDLQNQPVLTVSDINGFAKAGGMIEFSHIDDKVKIGVVNKGAAAKAGLRIDPGLFEVALKVISG